MRISDMVCSKCKHMKVSHIVTSYSKRYTVYCEHPNILPTKIGYTIIGTNYPSIKTKPRWCPLDK